MIYFLLLFTLYLYPNKCAGIDIIYDALTHILQRQLSEDGSFNFTELSKKYIRPAEEYDVTTEDGYILKLFHIPGNTSRVTLFCHGLLSSSDDFLLRGNTSLIYMTAMEGYDVWTMNCRGNGYSRRHVTLNPDTRDQFWDFSMHEIGIYDYKAMVDFVLKKTKQQSLSVVAHSEGTTSFFILASERPEYNKKVKVLVALAPITYLKHANYAWNLVIRTVVVLEILGIREFFGFYSYITKMIDLFCIQGLVGYEVCFNIVIATLAGFNPEKISFEFSKTISGHFPFGTSNKNILHYAYNYIKRRFAQYDYEDKNLEVYGSVTPPSYDLKKVITNVALFAAHNDQLVTVEDVSELKMELTNVVHFQIVKDKKFGHAGYIWAENAYIQLYPFVLSVLKKFN